MGRGDEQRPMGRRARSARWRVVMIGVWLSAIWVSGACDEIRVGAPDPARGSEAPPNPIEDDPGDAPCETLTRTACLRSVVCTLVAPPDAPPRQYTCREARGNCEVGLTQDAEDQSRCEDRTGCMWQPGGCYCPCRGLGRTALPDGAEARECHCECSGGPPPGCVPRAP